MECYEIVNCYIYIHTFCFLWKQSPFTSWLKTKCPFLVPRLATQLTTRGRGEAGREGTFLRQSDKAPPWVKVSPCSTTPGLTSAVSGQVGKTNKILKRNENEKEKKNPLIHAVSIWRASRQKTHASEFGWQEGVQDEHHWLWTRVEIKHL